MSSPKSSPRGQLSLSGSVPPFKAYLPRVDPTSGFPGSPSSVRRGTRRSSSLASPLPWCPHRPPGLFSGSRALGLVASSDVRPHGSVQPSIRVDHLIYQSHGTLYVSRRSKPGLGKRTLLTPAPSRDTRPVFRSPPPALYAHDPPQSPVLVTSLKALPSSVSSGLQCLLLSLRLHRPEPRLVVPPKLLRPRRRFAPFHVLPQRDQQLPGQRDDPFLSQPRVTSAKPSSCTIDSARSPAGTATSPTPIP